MRALSVIEADLAAASAEKRRAIAMVATLVSERAEAIKLRDACLLADFDGGLIPTAIAERHGMILQTVYSILWRNARRVWKRKTPIAQLPTEQRRAYEKAVRCGIGPKAARQMALAVPA